MLASQVFQTALSNKNHILESNSEWRKHTALFLSDEHDFVAVRRALLSFVF